MALRVRCLELPDRCPRRIIKRHLSESILLVRLEKNLLGNWEYRNRIPLHMHCREINFDGMSARCRRQNFLPVIVEVSLSVHCTGLCEKDYCHTGFLSLHHSLLFRGSQMLFRNTGEFAPSLFRALLFLYSYGLASGFLRRE